MRWKTLLCTVAVATATAGPALAQGRELVFTPLRACRLFDSRGGAPLAPGAPRTLTFRGQCGIPGLTTDGGVESNKAAALAVNLVAVDPTGPGFLLAWPANQPQPATSIINYSAATETGGLNIANGVILTMCDQVAAPACASGDMTFRAAVSATHLVVDVTGYFAHRVVELRAQRHGAGAGVDSFLCSNPSTGIRFGLSKHIANFAGADTTCPHGTWVCGRDEVSGDGIGCNTTRQDSFCDFIDCRGDCHDLPADGHKGWTRDGAGATAPVTRALTRNENGSRSSSPVCEYMPAWCCSRD
jgi:hypothetical protein